MADLLEQRLIEAGRHWQAAQPSPPPVPVNRLAAVGTRRTRTAWVEAAAAVAAAVAVAGGIAFAVTRPESPTEPLGPPPPAPSTHQVGPVVPGAVPFVPLPARHPDRRTMAAFGSVSVYGAISGRVRPGDTLSFTIRLVSTHDLPLDPCPDVTVSVGRASHTWQLNCAQVPWVDDQGRPYLPADRLVPFRMQVQVPDLPGRQKVLWVIDGPRATPGTYGIIRVG